MGAPQVEYCSAKGQNYLQTFTAEATVVDDTPPSVSVSPGGPLAAGGWVAGDQTLGYEAADNTGVKGVQAWVAGAGRAEDSRACDYTQRIPCSSGPGQITLDTGKLPEGTQQLHLAAVDAAGNTAESALVTVRVDHTPPGAVPVSVEGGEAWRNRDSFALDWQNPSEGDRAPIVAADWKVCSVGGGECQSGVATGPGVSTVGSLTVPGPGEWEAQMWRGDATLRVYTHMMARSEGERARLKALVRGERVIAVEAPAPRPLEIVAYEGPILRALAERGGQAPRREVLAAVGETLAGLHGPADLEPLPSGPPRWEPRMAKARTRMVHRGWLEAGARGAEWKLTRAARQKARREGWRAKGDNGEADGPASRRALAAAGRHES